MPVTVPAQWQNSASPALSGATAGPSSQSLPVTTTHAAGNWMLAICGWVQAQAGQGVSVNVDDDAFNRWEPLGAPTGDSSASGSVRTSIWYAPAARAANSAFGATTVMCAPTGAVLALGMIVIDVAGLNPWDLLAFIPVTAFAQAATTLSLTGGAPPANSFALTAAAADVNTSLTLTTGAGWTALTGTSVAGGGASPFALAAQWKTATTAQTAGWTAGATADLASIMGGVIVAAAAPRAANPNWPIVITEAAPGAGPGTPAAQLNWQALSARELDFSVQQGQPYLLGGPQAATGGMVLDNPDLAVSPPGSGVWAGMDSGTPLRVRAIWPASATPHYVRFSGFLQQAPTSFDEQLRGQVQATLTDAYAYATSSLRPCLQAELLTDPTLYALWPCTDPAGSGFASNRAPGNQNPLTVMLSKYGTGPATQAFGQNSGGIKGDSGSGMWGQAGLPSPTNSQGSSLHCSDPNFPSITGGVTVEGWFQASSTTPAFGYVLVLANSSLDILKMQISNTAPFVTVFGSQTQALDTDLTVGSTNVYPFTVPFHFAVAFNRTSYLVMLNGGALGTLSGTWTYQLPPAFTDIWCNGAFPPYSAAATNGYNGYTGYVAVFSSMLPAGRIAAHYQAGAGAFAGEYTHQRIERILAYSAGAGRRVIVPEAPGMPGGFTVPAGTDVTPMASMSTLGGTIAPLYTPGTPGFTPAAGTQASSALAGTAASVTPAITAVNPAGAFFFYPRSYASAQPVKWVLGDSQAAGEIPVWPGASWPYDPGTVKNDVQLTQPDTGTVTVPGLPEAGSAAQYGTQTYQVTAYLQLDATSGYTPSPAMSDLANWVASANYSPRMRATATVKASHISPAVAAQAWPFILGAAPGDTVTVNARPPTSGAVISVTGRIVQVQPKLTIDGNGTEGSLTFTLDIAPELNTLTCDSVTNGVLNGVNCLGW